MPHKDQDPEVATQNASHVFSAVQGDACLQRGALTDHCEGQIHAAVLHRRILLGYFTTIE